MSWKHDFVSTRAANNPSAAEQRMHADTAAYHELCCYTLTHGDPAFIHQHVVDAFAAQDAKADDKPIRLTFALVGLYLHVARGFTGREVQQAHMKLARKKRQWPSLQIPADRGQISAATVLAAEPGTARDNQIHQWTVSVWNAFAENRATIEHLLAEHGISGVHSLR
jgi:Family of unknown function (DUF5946)